MRQQLPVNIIIFKIPTYCEQLTFFRSRRTPSIRPGSSVHRWLARILRLGRIWKSQRRVRNAWCRVHTCPCYTWQVPILHNIRWTCKLKSRWIRHARKLDSRGRRSIHGGNIDATTNENRPVVAARRRTLAVGHSNLSGLFFSCAMPFSTATHVSHVGLCVKWWRSFQTAETEQHGHVRSQWSEAASARQNKKLNKMG